MPGRTPERHRRKKGTMSQCRGLQSKGRKLPGPDGGGGEVILRNQDVGNTSLAALPLVDGQLVRIFY
jgi:hypothetical protein